MLRPNVASAEMIAGSPVRGYPALQKVIQTTALRRRRKLMALSCATAEDVLKTIKDEKVQMIDLRFTDLPGVWQHFSVPPSAADTDALDEGIGFDGSSIRGFQEIQKATCWSWRTRPRPSSTRSPR